MSIRLSKFDFHLLSIRITKALKKFFYWFKI